MLFKNTSTYTQTHKLNSHQSLAKGCMWALSEKPLTGGIYLYIYVYLYMEVVSVRNWHKQLISLGCEAEQAVRKGRLRAVGLVLSLQLMQLLKTTSYLLFRPLDWINQRNVYGSLQNSSQLRLASLNDSPVKGEPQNTLTGAL